MRVLVTRPQAEAARTAQALRDLGHQPVLLPLTRIEATDAAIPAEPYDAVVATSANALCGRDVPESVLTRPFFAVGGRTAEAARAAGFADVRTGTGTAARLALRIVQDIGVAGRVLFLAGCLRKPDLALALDEAGLRLIVVETYRAGAAALAETDWASAQPIEAVLHYSRASAERYAALALRMAKGVRDGGAAQLCLSADVAQGLSTLPHARIFIAEGPDELSLFALLNICHSGRDV